MLPLLVKNYNLTSLAVPNLPGLCSPLLLTAPKGSAYPLIRHLTTSFAKIPDERADDEKKDLFEDEKRVEDQHDQRQKIRTDGFCDDNVPSPLAWVSIGEGSLVLRLWKPGALLEVRDDTESFDESQSFSASYHAPWLEKPRMLVSQSTKEKAFRMADLAAAQLVPDIAPFLLLDAPWREREISERQSEVGSDILEISQDGKVLSDLTGKKEDTPLNALNRGEASDVLTRLLYSKILAELGIETKRSRRKKLDEDWKKVMMNLNKERGSQG